MQTIASFEEEFSDKAPLPLLQKLLGHSSIRTTALYWRNIYGEDDIPNILTGKIWLEKPKEPPKPPSENFALPETLEPIIRDKPVIPMKKPIQQDNSPLLTEINEKSTITNQREQENQKENVLLVKIKQLEEQLKKTQAENDNFKTVVQSEK